jgi:phosphopantothenoylcysteine decarboxylase / phosphopantothenate---cysteine ligase
MQILLIITGGIAAYKSLDLIRRLREAGHDVRCILSRGGSQFITPLAVSALSGHDTYTDLWSLKDEVEMGHIRLSREADLILLCPASANILAKMARGIADDLASTTLLAANKPIAVVPSMNTQMWLNAATAENLRILAGRGIWQIGPNAGDLACGEIGPGRMADVAEITAWVENFQTRRGLLAGKNIVITAGPTREAIDPVRFISNHSSGRQGYAIAAACAMAGARVTLITGPTALPPPANCQIIPAPTAQDMLTAVLAQLPCDVFIGTAAVSDWQAATPVANKIKKQPGQNRLELSLQPTPDILAAIGQAGNRRPALVIGFAAETEHAVANAQAKLTAKNCDWVLANDVGQDPAIMGGVDNQIIFVTKTGHTAWPKMRKTQVAEKLVDAIAAYFG